MRSILVLSLLSAALACASEATDRVSIDRLIRTLNESPQSPDLFASGFDGANDLWRITHNTAFSNSKIGSWLPAEAGSGHVTISHEPMGEATFSTVPLPRPVVVDGPPRFVVQSLRFLAPDVALLDTVQELPRSSGAEEGKESLAYRLSSRRSSAVKNERARRSTIYTSC
jgi:hypothetical protein